MAGEIKTLESKALKTEMERAEIQETSLQVSRVALGTWAIGGWSGVTPMKRSLSRQSRALSSMASILSTLLPSMGSAAPRKLSARRSRMVIWDQASLGQNLAGSTGEAGVLWSLKISRLDARSRRIDLGSVFS
jgi:hypothetical protein